MNFVPLHVYSGYSFTKSGLKISQYLDASQKLGYKCVGISDYQNLSVVPSFIEESYAKGLTPIVGEEVYIDNLNVCFYVLNEIGYRNLLKIQNAVQAKEASFDYVRDNSTGLVIVLPTENDALKKAFVEDKEQFAHKLARVSRGLNNFYLGLEVNDQINYVSEMRDFAFNHGYKVCAFPLIRYVKKDDAIVYEMMKCIETKDTLSEKQIEGPEYLLNSEEIALKYKENEINATQEIAKMVTFHFDVPRGKMISFKNEEGLTSDEYLEKLAKESLREKGKTAEIYQKRLTYELETIKKMGYSDYFLIVHDYVSFARKADIAVGPGRGSAAGSLVAYALGITVPDPIEYNLLFERFLNPNRQTMPDIDVDFSDIDRERVVDYLKDKYGNDHVAKIIAIQKIGAKQSLRDVGRIFNYPKHDIELFTKLITDEKDDKLTLRQIYKTNEKFKALVNDDKYYLEIVTLASKIEGFPRQASLHAVGIVLNAEPLQEVIPLDAGLDTGLVEQFEKDYLEKQGFLKMDILAIRNLSIIDHCLSLLKAKGIFLNRDEIPYDDELAIKEIASGKTMGIFQLESIGMRKAIQQLKPTQFEDIVAILALYRPGPMESIPSYGKRKAGKEKITYLSEAIKDILAPTYGIIVYQEQIMQIANKMAGFNLAQADLFRRAISKKDSKKLSSLKSAFINGSIKQKYTKEEAEKVFTLINKFADYGFNRSHALVYAIFSCRMAYLKAKYPAEFYASILSNASPEEFNNTVLEMRDIGLKVACPDINRSTTSFILNENKIIFPLQAIKGINTMSALALLQEREKNGPFKDIFDFVLRMYQYRINSTQIVNIINAGSFDNIEKSRSSLKTNIPAALNYAEAICDQDGQMIIDPNMFPRPTFNRVEDDVILNLNLEKDALGLMVSGSLLDSAKEVKEKLHAVELNELANTKGDTKVVCILKSFRYTKTKKGMPMAFITVYDDTGEMELIVFTDAYEKSSTALKKKESIIVLSGYYSSYKNQFNLTLVQTLEEVKNA